MQSWSGSIDAATGQMIVAKTHVICPASCVARLTVPQMNIDIPFSVNAPLMEGHVPECVVSIRVVSLTPQANGIAVVVQFFADADLKLAASWTVDNEFASLSGPSLTAG